MPFAVNPPLVNRAPRLATEQLDPGLSASMPTSRGVCDSIRDLGRELPGSP